MNVVDGRYSTVGVASARAFFHRLTLLLLAGVLVDACLAFLHLNPSKSYFILVPFAVLGIYSLGFAAALYAIGARELSHKAASVLVFAERHRCVALAILIGLGITGSLVAVWVLRAFPNSGDEYAYLFEAKTFLAGRLWNSVPPIPALFENAFVYSVNGKWVAVYPPGWPLLLATVMALRLPPWFAAPLCGCAALIAAYKLGKKRDGVHGGLLAVALIAFSPFFLFNAGSYFDNLPATAAGLFFGWAALAFLDRPRWSNALGIGLALGIVGLIRAQDVILFGLPFAIQFFFRARKQHYGFLPGVIVAGLPFLLGLLFYNLYVLGSPTGAPSRFPGIKFGLFSIDEEGNHLTPFDQMLYFVARMVLMADWNSPCLIFGYILAFWIIMTNRHFDFLDFILPTYIIGFMLIPLWGGNQYGPRYYFEGFPFLVLTLVSGIGTCFRDPRFSQWRASAALLLTTHGVTVVAALAIIIPFVRAVVNQRMDIYDQVKAAQLHNAVVVVRSETGTISPMATYDLVRNDIAADGNVVYVLNVPNQVEKLHELLPERRFYAYERDPSNPKGRLQRLW